MSAIDDLVSKLGTAHTLVDQLAYMTSGSEPIGCYAEVFAEQRKQEREAIVDYILMYASRHVDIRRAALEVVAEHIRDGGATDPLNAELMQKWRNGTEA